MVTEFSNGCNINSLDPLKDRPAVLYCIELTIPCGEATAPITSALFF
jgi:hypothetical protein